MATQLKVLSGKIMRDSTPLTVIQTYKPGIYPNIPIEEYHRSEGISSTGVSLILDCAARYNYKYNVEPYTLSPKELAEQNKKYAKGRMVHTLVLEPEKFDALYYVMEADCDLRTKDGKAAWMDAELAANGREIIRLSDVQDIRGMANAVNEMPLFSYLKAGCIEHSLFWNDGIYDTRLRARPDLYTDDFIVDLKTTASIPDFERSIKNFGYHRQASMQLDGLHKLTGKHRVFGFLVVETKAPFLTKLISLDQDYLELGRTKYLQAAEIYSECKASGVWGGYGNDFSEAKMPKYLNTGDENYVW